MPSGAKKRKAAKKKKAHHYHHSHEHDDLRHHEERDSDGGEAEALSPASQGHNDAFPNDGHEELEDPPPAGSVGASESNSSEVDTVNLVGAPKDGFEETENVEIAEEVKSEDGSESKADDMECVQVEAVEISANGSEEKSNSVGFDNGSQVVKEKVNQEEVETVVLEASRSDDLVKQMNFLPKEPAQIVESFLVVDSVELVSSVSEKVSHVSETLVEENLADSASTLKDPDEKVAPLIDEESQVSVKKIDETATVVTNEIAGKSMGDRKEGKFLVTLEASIARSSEVVETAKESERPKPSVNQPPVAPPPKVVHKTSWFSCCGIFDVITGS